MSTGNGSSPDDDGVEEDEDRLPGHKVAYAANWRTVLAVDGLVGIAVLVVGITLAIAWNPIVGGFIGSLGFVYVAMVVRRYRQWAELRRDAGFD